MVKHQRNHSAADRPGPSPSQRYAAFQKRQAHNASVAARFAATLPFDLDDFQQDAIDALERGENVLVAAPTGAGKTVVADFAMYLARERNVKAFYTTPIKALSNQKYHDLTAVYGADRVGLLTGDISINSEADIVVMTTEVLRNMLYEHSTTLNALRFVILDEVHYLADRFRGPVWEEVIIHLPRQVSVIGLSATVSNVEDFSSWISSVRGDTKLVVSERRPVPLEQHVLVQADDHTEPELLDLYRRDAQGEQTTKLNARLIDRLDQLDRQAARRRGAENSRSRGRGHSRGHAPAQRHTPKRWAVVDELNYLDMLPGIYFIFSRNGCDQAVEQCINAGLELTTEDEMRRIRAIVDEMVAGQLSQEDLKALQFSRFRFALEEGFASHHAGMVALFRQIVERLFEEGLVKMVFATETLALGVYPLHSSFHATFNMAVNLLNTSDYETTRATLDHSFAQWEANESAWQLESQLTTLKQALDGYEQAFHCEYGDFASLMRIRMELSDLEKNGRRKLKQTAFPTDEQRKNTFRELDQSIETLKKRDREHPCRQCPDMQQHMKWGHRWIREMREYERVQHRYESRTGSVARQFDRICSILEQLGYVKRDGTDMRLSEQGQLLRHIYSEQDIVLAEALERGMFDHLTARQLAAVLSALVFEARGGTGGEPRRWPGGIQGPVAQTSQSLDRLHAQLTMLCEDEGLDDLQQLDFGIVDIMYDWASGNSLAYVLHDRDMTGGDFVRNAKRLSDILQQISAAEPYLPQGSAHLAQVAHEAMELVNRGIVAYSGIGEG